MKSFNDPGQRMAAGGWAIHTARNSRIQFAPNPPAAALNRPKRSAFEYAV